jgi:hypothetical protein
MISLSTEGFKFSALANGGAVVALLAYLGNKDPAPDMRMAMFWFLFGVFACGVSLVFAYLTQLKLLNEIFASDGAKKVEHAWLLWISIFAYAFSIIFLRWALGMQSTDFVRIMA